jgi:Uma2 family endonuclease
VLEVAQKRFTVHEFDCMAEAAIFDENERVELIDGAIIRMNPIGDRHATAVEKLTNLLAPLMASGVASLNVHNPVALGRFSEPYPDLALLYPPPGGRRHGRPTVADVILLIEVSDTTLGYDRTTKVPLYARAGVPEMWIVDVGGEHVFVYRAPSVDGYAETQTLRRGERVSPQAFPELVLSVNEILG